jgi:hypothetical protein
VSRASQLSRFVLWSALAVVLTILLLVSAIQVEQRLLRRRAERLLTDIRALNLRHSDWSMAQALMKRWGKWGHYEGSCTEQYCRYEVELEEFAYKHSNLFVNRPFAWSAYQAIGGKPAYVRAGWGVDEGRIWTKGFNVWVEVPPRRGRKPEDDRVEYTLIGSADSISHLPSREWPTFSLHPNYMIGTPAGCEICLHVYTKFTPYADGADVQRLMTFNLACLTAWHPCRERGDIMPLAWKQYLTEMPRWQDNWRALMKCDNYPLELLGRDSENVALADVESAHQEKKFGEPVRTVQARLLRRMKGARKWQVGTLQELLIGEQMVNSGVQYGLEDVAPGRQFVFLLDDWSRWQQPNFQVEVCGVLPATPGNIDAIQRGIQMDYAAKRRDAE